MRKIKIAIDFDGVLCKREGIPTIGDFRDCEPTDGAVSAVRLFIKENFDLYVCTNRDETQWDDIKLWLKKHGFPAMDVTNVKQKNTSVYLDDRAVRFTNWDDFRKIYF